MKKIINVSILTVAIAALLSASPVPSNNTPPAPVYPIPTSQQVDWQKLETYAFVHFGLNTFNDLEWGFGDTPASTFNPTDLDVDQWARIIKAAGFKGIILTAKHHDGFCLWQTKYTEYSVKNSPWKDGKGDMVRELIDACKKYKLKFGLYLSPWDRNHAEYGKPAYTEYFQNQIKELIDEYCTDVDLFEYWFDGANGGDGYYGGTREKRNIDATKYYQYERAIKTIHDKHPAAMIFGGTVPSIRWVGNEEGWAGQTNWSFHYNTNNLALYGSKNGDYNGPAWLPAECDVSIRPGWFYHAREDHSVHSLSHLVDIYYESVGRNATLLMNFPVALSGKIHPIDSARIMQWHETLQAELKTNLALKAKVKAGTERGSKFAARMVNDSKWDTYWATSDGVTTGELTFEFAKPTTLNRVLLQEYIPLGQRVAKFSIDYYANGKWQPIVTSDTMTTIGYKRIIRTATTTAEKLRINFLEARGPLTINNIEMFLAPGLMVEPTIKRNSQGLVSLSSGDQATKIYYTTDGSAPTLNSTLYTTPFELPGKGTVEAIAHDPTFNKQSPVASKKFDVLSTGFNISGAQADAMFDSNNSTVYSPSSGTNELVINLGKQYDVCGFTYMPDGSRWGGGAIGGYEIWANGTRIAQGEFSNIKANPIEQIIEFSQPVKTDKLTFVITKIADGANRARIVEFGILTK